MSHLTPSASDAEGLRRRLEVAAELLDHKSPAVTLTVYAHVLAGMVEEAAAELSTSLMG